MATVTLGGNPIKTSGELPTVGSNAPQFQLVQNDLSVASLENFAGSKLVLNHKKNSIIYSSSRYDYGLSHFIDLDDSSKLLLKGFSFAHPLQEVFEPLAHKDGESAHRLYSASDHNGLVA